MCLLNCLACPDGEPRQFERERFEDRAGILTATLDAQTSVAAADEIDRILEKERFDEAAESDTSEAADVERVRVAMLAQDVIFRRFPALKSLTSTLKRPHGPAAAMVRGLPVADRGKLALSSAVSLALGLACGEVFQYRQQNGGRMAARLTPIVGAAENSGNSDSEFLWHTDDSLVASPYRTRWIGLLGVENDYGAATGFAPVAPTWDDLAAEQPTILKVLEMYRYVFGAPKSFGIGQYWSAPRPILWRNEAGVRCISFPTYNTEPADPHDVEAKEALVVLRNYAARHARMHVIGRGDWFVFANDQGLHNRQTIVGNRLVLRTYARSGLDDLRRVTGSAGWVFDLPPIIRASIAA